MMRAYRSLAGAFIRSRLSYRLSFAARATAVALSDLAPLLLVGMVLTRFSSVAGWRWPELALLHGLSQTAGSLARCFSVPLDRFDELIVSGDFDTIMTRPLSPLLHVLAGGIELVHASRVVLGTVVMMLAGRAACVPPTAGNLALVAAAVLGGGLLIFALTLMVAALSFWQTRTGKLQDIVQASTRAFAEFPLGIYPSGVRVVLTWILPLALATYFPARRMLGLPDSDGPASIAALPVGGLFLAIGLVFWRAGVKRYRSTGS